VSQSVHEPLWSVEEFGEWVLEIYEDHIRYIDHYEGVTEIAFKIDWE
jgi:hypothetical protein